MKKRFESHGETLSTEHLVATIRFHTENTSKHFDAVCTYTTLSDDVVKISGMLGRMTRHRLRCLLELLKTEGFSCIYIERINGGIPGGVLIQEGDFKGWWKVQIKENKDE